MMVIIIQNVKIAPGSSLISARKLYKTAKKVNLVRQKDKINVPLIAMALVLFLLSGLMFTGTANAAPVPAIDVGCGATWIQWNWATPLDVNISVYVDGVLQDSGTSLGFFVLSDLKPNERHRLDLVNGSVGGDSGSSVIVTHRSALHLVVFFLFAFVLLLFGRWYCYISLLAVVWMSYVMREMITYDYAGMYMITSGFLMILSLAVFGEQFRKSYLRDGKLRLW